MSERPDTNDYLNLFLNDIPMMDVRAPVEFNQGTFPTARNVPILDDKQREQIGIQYKQAGQEEAIKLGLELATSEIRQQRFSAWKAFCETHENGFLYCFRGGLRSRTTQAWLREQGVHYPLIKGGYKALRRFLIDELQTSIEQVSLIIVSGLTGSGKTSVLQKIHHHVDLERLANHRGSAFGRDVFDSQPTAINWENSLSIALLKHRFKSPEQTLFVEDEGRLIGRLCLPETLYQKMLEAPRAILEVDIDTRVNMILQDYIASAWPEYQHHYQHTAEQEFSQFVLKNLDRIQKRLGGQKYKNVRQIFTQALEQLFTNNETQTFKQGIQILLQDYYDPMYEYQLKQKQVEILFRGNRNDYIEWANNRLEL